MRISRLYTMAKASELRTGEGKFPCYTLPIVVWPHKPCGIKFETTCVSTRKIFSSHSLSSPQPGLGTLDITWNRDTIITCRGGFRGSSLGSLEPPLPEASYVLTNTHRACRSSFGLRSAVQSCQITRPNLTQECVLTP